MAVFKNFFSRIVALCFLVSVGAGSASSAEFDVKPNEEGLAVAVDDKPFAEYRTNSGHQPIIWPIVDAAGRQRTRSYPQGPRLPNEQVDHPHHRSLWFAHGKVNGRDFWVEPADQHGGKDARKNKIVHREFVRSEANDAGAVIVTANDWLAGDDRVLEDERTIRFGAKGDLRWIDFGIELKATDGDVEFGDTKEGCFSVRVAGSMDVTAKLGGQIVNDRNRTDDDAWGREAAWVNYTGPVDDKPAGIAIFIHPTSARSPHRWHVRTYGLFAANPFSKTEFPQDDDPKGGPLKIAKGESAKFRYLVLFHNGDLTADVLEDWKERYAADRL